jgi:hypothetical protein
MLLLAYSAEVFGELTLHSMFSQVWAFPFLVYLVATDTSKISRWLLWTIITLLIGYPNPHAIQVNWNSRNSNTVRSRTVSAACYNMFVQAGGIVAAYVYQTKDADSEAPDYSNGNRILLSLCCANLVIYSLTKVYYVMRNRTRDKVWGAMNEQQRLEYLNTTKDEGSKRLDFRFAH